jgi:crotonobetainyl-CoA:carnitine CoA-transferase CaiB-like acyl-CoA transferase
MSGVDRQMYLPPPLLGEHTEKVLKEILGYPPEKILALRKRNII